MAPHSAQARKLSALRRPPPPSPGSGSPPTEPASMGPPPVAKLPDELIEEILLRIPPSDPATLARVAAAQKRWCRLAASEGFRRRYRARHRTPPTLGFFCNPIDGGVGFSTSFVRASSFRPKPHPHRRAARRRQLLPVDARHGRVLLHSCRQSDGAIKPAKPGLRLVVWDPITGHRVALPRPKRFFHGWTWKATVLCAAPAGSCDHLDCHRGHSVVVLIGDHASGMRSCIYSSQDGVWSKIMVSWDFSAALDVHSERSAHVGNALYCMLELGNKILKYDLGTRKFSVMEPPVMLSCDESTGSERIQLTTMEDGQLGLAVLRKSVLYILSTDEGFGWGQTKTIDLQKCGNYVPATAGPSLIGFAGDHGLVFVKDGVNGILSVDLRSAQVKVVYKRPCLSRIVPYINFCTPAMGGPFEDDPPRAGASRFVRSCVARQASSVLRQGEIL